QSPGAQAADCLAYPIYVQEQAGIAEVSELESNWPENLPERGMWNLRAPISIKTLEDLKQGQIAMGGFRRRLGRYWSRLDGFPVGWTVQPLEIGGYVLMPPQPSRSPQLEVGLLPEIGEPVGFVRLECE